MKMKIIISIFFIILLSPQVFASELTGVVTIVGTSPTVIRTIEGDDFLRVGDINKNTTINLTSGGGNNTTFQFWGVVETLPPNVSVNILTHNVSVIKNNYNYSFVIINSSTLRYNITPTHNSTPGYYNITGYFVDSYNNTHKITPFNTTIRIFSESFDVMFYDRNNNGSIEREEVLEAVSDYFKYIITIDDVLVVVRDYLKI